MSNSTTHANKGVRIVRGDMMLPKYEVFIWSKGVEIVLCVFEKYDNANSFVDILLLNGIGDRWQVEIRSI